MSSEPQEQSSSRVFGNSARIGLIVPTTNTVNEAEWQQLTVPDVSYHSARMPLHAAGGDDLVPARLREVLGELTAASPTCIAYSCTAGSMVTPVDAMPRAMSEAAGVACISTAEAVIEALRQLGARSVAVATPYHDALNEQWKEFLSECGFEVTIIRGLGIGAGGAGEFKQIARLGLDAVQKHARETFSAGPADALLLSCTDMPTLPLLEPLERELGVPVLSSNSATLWHALNVAGVAARPASGGRLLAADKVVANA